MKQQLYEIVGTMDLSEEAEGERGSVELITVVCMALEQIDACCERNTTTVLQQQEQQMSVEC